MCEIGVGREAAGAGVVNEAINGAPVEVVVVADVLYDF